MIFAFFILGLIIGSFLNAVIYRLKAVESLWERSHCPKCRKKISWHDNIPLLSFVLLSGRCRSCGETISWAYPLTEFFTGVLFALVASCFFVLGDATTYLPTLFYLIIFSLLIIIFVYDFQYMEIPMLIFWLATGISILYYLIIDWGIFQSQAGGFSLNLFSGVLAGAIVAALFFVLTYFSKETWMGYGDVYMGFLVGLLVGWPAVFLSLTLSFTIGALFGVGLVLFSRRTMKSQVPFAPFLIFGIILTILLPEIFPKLGSFLFYM